MAKKKRGARRRRKKDEGPTTDGAADTPEGCKQRGSLAFRSGSYARAAECFTRGIAMTENKVSDVAIALRSNRSACYSKMDGRASEALQDARWIVKNRPDWDKGHVRKAVALEALCRYPCALAAYKIAANMDPKLGLSKQISASEETIRRLGLVGSPAGRPVLCGSIDGASGPGTRKTRALCEWLLSHGARFPKTFIRSATQDGRGLYSLCDQSAGAETVFIPEKVILTLERAKQSEIGRAIEKSGYTPRSKHTALACFILQERQRGAASFWGPYIAALPETFPRIPIFFDRKRLELLRGTTLYDSVQHRRDAIEDEYSCLCRAVPAIRRHAFGAFMWARYVVMTRILGLKISGTKTSGLVPYLGFVNHERPGNVRWEFRADAKGAILLTTRSVATGEQLSGSYGRKDASRFLLNYGFTVQQSNCIGPLDPYGANCATFSFTLSREAERFGDKTQLIESLAPEAGWVDSEHSAPAMPGDPKFEAMFSFVRFLVASGPEMNDLLARADPAEGSSGINLFRIGPISVDNEVRALKAIRVAAMRRLAAFSPESKSSHQLKTSTCASAVAMCGLRADHARIKANLWEDATEMDCVIARTCEKEVLIWFMRLADVVSQQLEAGGRSRARERLATVLASVNALEPKVYTYVRRSILPLL